MWQEYHKRVPKACCHPRIVLLLLWKFLFTSSVDLLANSRLILLQSSQLQTAIFNTSILVSSLLAPLIGWLADVKLGRYRVLICVFIGLFVSNIFYVVSVFTSKMISELFSYIGVLVSGIVNSGFTAAMLPFLSDQIIGANADELSAVVYWFLWMEYFAFALNTILTSFPISPTTLTQVISVPCAAVPILILSSAFLCKQLLDRTHKVTNPIKIIIQVLYYAKKHRYPERRSAFTYMDEEQPTRIDFGKEKFGGPFTEEEVEDVKTVLRLLPIVVCVIISQGGPHISLRLNAFNNSFADSVMNDAIGDSCWLPPLILIPLSQFLVYPFFHRWIPSMLKRIGFGLFFQLLATVLSGAVIKGYEYSNSGNLMGYLTCNGSSTITDIEWYWRVFPLVLYCFGRAIFYIVMIEFTIAQSPDKMKGLVIGVFLLFDGISGCIGEVMEIGQDTICYSIPAVILLTILFLSFVFLSKRYKLRERNREINIQAIVEEHYERYMDQEAEYMRENPQYDDESDSTIVGGTYRESNELITS